MSEEIIDQQEQKKASNGTFQLEDNSGRAKIASIFVLLVTASNIPLLVVEYSFLQAMQNGDRFAIEETEVIVGIVGLLQVLLNIPSIIFFIRWFKRAYTNLNTRVKTDETPGWTIGSWFIPIVSLYKPFQMLKEMWTRTLEILNNQYDQKLNHSNLLLSFWWLFWIITSIGGSITLQISNRSTDMDNLIIGGKIDLILSMLSFPLGILAYFVITKYNKLETQLSDLELEKNLLDNQEID